MPREARFLVPCQAPLAALDILLPQPPTVFLALEAIFFAPCQAPLAALDILLPQLLAVF